MRVVVVSLFDGIRVAKLALDDLEGVEVVRYYSSEIDKNAIIIGDANHPTTIPYKLGDVKKIDYTLLNEEISKLGDVKVLLIGGSPCQGFSKIGLQLGLTTFDGSAIVDYETYRATKFLHVPLSGQSVLFWEYIRAKRELKHDYYLLENVPMGKDNMAILTTALGNSPVKINSNLVSVQNRSRLYWSNSSISQPVDLNLSFQDIKDDLPMRPIGKWLNAQWGAKTKLERLARLNEVVKLNTITTSRTHSMQYYLNNDSTEYRNLSIREIEQSQNLPLGYTSAVSITSGCRGVGNSFTKNVIVHILKGVLNVR